MVDAMVPVVSVPSLNSTEPFAVLHPALADTRPAWLKSRVSGPPPGICVPSTEVEMNTRPEGSVLSSGESDEAEQPLTAAMVRRPMTAAAMRMGSH